MFRRCFILCVLIFSWFLTVNGALNIKDFLGDEPLTKRRIAEDIITYFQQDDPAGIPILDVPEKLEVGGPFQTTQMTLDDLSITGHSKISLDYLDVNLQKLQFQLKLNIPHLEILGTYEWPGWWSSSEGDLNITFVNLDVGAICDFGVDDEGVIQVVDMKAIFEKELFIPTLTGLSTQHSVIIYAADTFFDSTVVPLIQSGIKTKGMTALNKRLQERLKDRSFPLDISPVDYLIAKMRSDIVRKRNLDPIVVKEREIKALGLSVVLKNITLEGLSTLHRSEEIRTEFVDNKIYVTIEIGTQALKGSVDWLAYSSLFPLGSGHADIHIESLSVSVEVQQDADVRHPPILRRINIELGNIALRSEGERKLDYILEAVINLFPNIIRNSVLNRKIEERLKQVVQQRFNTLNLELIIRERLAKLDN